MWAERRGNGVRAPQRYAMDLAAAEWGAAEAREALACRTSAALFDLSPFGKCANNAWSHVPYMLLRSSELGTPSLRHRPSCEVPLAWA